MNDERSYAKAKADWEREQATARRVFAMQGGYSQYLAVASSRITKNCDELDRLEKLDGCVYYSLNGDTHPQAPGVTRWPFDKDGLRL